MIAPKLRFSEFKDCWKEKTIFEIAENNSLANGVFNDKNKVGKGYKLINVLDMYLERDINETKLTLLDLDKNEFERNKVQYGDIFFTRSSLVKEGIAHSNVYLGYSEDITYDGHLIKLSPNQNLFNSIFLNYNFKTANVRNQLIKGGKTATMTTIGQQEVGNTKIFFPTKKEQTKIAEFLSAVDDKINQLSRQLELLNQYKKGVMQKIFSQEIRFKNENGEDFGEWEYIKLSKIASIQGGFAFKSDYFGSGINKVIKIGDVTGRMYLKNFKGSTSSELPEERYQVSINSVLIALSGATFGKLGLILDNEKAFINQRVAKIYPTQNNINLFIYFLMQTNEFYNYIQSIPSASAQPNISNQDVLNYEFYCPQFEEQQKIAEFLTAIDERIDHTTAQLTHTKQWKKGLLQQMFA